MGPGQLQFRDVLEMIELIKASSNFSEVRLRTGELEIELRRSSESDVNGSTPPPLDAQPGVASRAADPAAAPSHEAGRAAPQARAPRKDSVPDRAGVQLVCAPMVGTIYRAPQPGAAPFVKVGQAVLPNTQLCIIEVMKLMNSIEAGCAGIVSEILVTDRQTVEPGQELFAITLR